MSRSTKATLSGTGYIGRRSENKLERAAELWTQGRTLGQIATELKVARSTVYRWKIDPIFADLVASYRYQTMARCFERCVQLQHEAIDTLGALLKSKSASIRLRAAQTITEMNAKHFLDRQADETTMKLEEQILAMTKAHIPHPQRVVDVSADEV